MLYYKFGFEVKILIVTARTDNGRDPINSSSDTDNVVIP